jgi:thymidylate synthase ThyX
MEVTFPRIILAEFNTHRAFSRNSASSRAIPVEKMIERVLDDPFVPVHFGKNQKGMQAKEEVGEAESEEARRIWLEASREAAERAKTLSSLGIHKQVVNRLLEPFLWHTVIVTATQWSNFFALRCHPDAEPHMEKIARMMQEEYRKSEPVKREWHIPYISGEEEEELDVQAMLDISVGRCARVSYLTHDGVRDIGKDIELCQKLLKSGHWSPFEHQARDLMYTRNHAPNVNLCGNFNGWIQHRKMFVNECR